jgi:steroid delta-isomerase-like uncharacterized protein
LNARGRTGKHEEVFMPHQNTATIMQGYLDALVARGDFDAYLADDATFEIMGTDQKMHGRDAVRGIIVWMHTQAFDAHPKVRTVIAGDNQAALEADFIGTHTGDFAGVAATGRSVNIPYTVIYDVEGDKIRALRAYMPMDQFLQQIRGDA